MSLTLCLMVTFSSWYDALDDNFEVIVSSNRVSTHRDSFSNILSPREARQDSTLKLDVSHVKPCGC